MQEPWIRDEAVAASDARIAVRVSELEQLPVGASLVAGLVTLRGVSMDCASAVQVTALWDRVISFAHAESMISCTEAVRAGDLPTLFSKHDAAHIVAQDLAAMTHVPFATAMDRVALVEQVGRQLPLSWEALNRGDLSVAHLKALARETAVCTPRVAQAVDARVIPEAITRGWTPSQLGKAAAKAIIALDPDGAADRAKKAKADADVVLYPESNETASMVATGDAVTMRRLMDTIDARAAQMGRDGDLRRVGQRRLAALADYVLGQRTPSDRPVVEAVVTIDLTTVLGLTQHPGELSGYGPISAETARELTKDAMLRRLITDPITSTMIDLGRTRYRPSPMLRRIVDSLHRTCRFPGCSRRAIACDCDHATAFNAGGETKTSNLHPLCRMHHNLKTNRLWTVELNPDGTESWTSALGFRYTKPAATYPVESLEPPEEINVPESGSYGSREADPDPPLVDDPLPEPPPITDEEYEAFTDALEQRCYAYANDNYDQWQRLGLVS